MGLPTNTVGTMSELRIALDLLARGYEVFRTMSTNSHFDIVAFKNGDIFKIEVKTGYKSHATGKLEFPRHSHDDWDVMGVCINEGNEIHYLNQKGIEIEM